MAYSVAWQRTGLQNSDGAKAYRRGPWRRQLNVSPSHVSRLESGHRGAQLDTLHAVAAALGVSVTDLFTNQAMEYLPDFAPYAPPAGSILAKSLRSGSQKMFKTLTNAVSEVGFAKGDLFFVDMRELATSELCSSDIVVAEIIPSSPKKAGATVAAIHQPASAEYQQPRTKLRANSYA